MASLFFYFSWSAFQRLQIRKYQKTHCMWYATKRYSTSGICECKCTTHNYDHHHTQTAGIITQCKSHHRTLKFPPTHTDTHTHTHTQLYICIYIPPPPPAQVAKCINVCVHLSAAVSAIPLGFLIAYYYAFFHPLTMLSFKLGKTCFS